jgi:hypothetical protein
MKYLSDDHRDLYVHAHPSDNACHWSTILKPLAFLVGYDAFLNGILVKSALRNGNQFHSSATYIKWVCCINESGLINLLNVFLLVLELRGLPTYPEIGVY